jgi:intracellular sulfur oxidation DsrE/DsrF family protein
LRQTSNVARANSGGLASVGRPLIALLTALVLLGCGPSANSEGGYGRQKVVYHINYDNPDKQFSALRNVQNHIKAVGATNLEIKVVLHGRGVSLLRHATTDMGLQEKVVSLKQQDVRFRVCNDTLKRNNVDYEKDLFDVSPNDIVPNGIAELARLQTQGYTYIKP